MLFIWTTLVISRAKSAEGENEEKIVASEVGVRLATQCVGCVIPAHLQDGA